MKNVESMIKLVFETFFTKVNGYHIIEIHSSKTTWGTSYYVYVYKNEKILAFRISDHPSSYRYINAYYEIKFEAPLLEEDLKEGLKNIDLTDQNHIHNFGKEELLLLRMIKSSKKRDFYANFYLYDDNLQIKKTSRSIPKVVDDVKLIEKLHLLECLHLIIPSETNYLYVSPSGNSLLEKDYLIDPRGEFDNLHNWKVILNYFNKDRILFGRPSIFKKNLGNSNNKFAKRIAYGYGSSIDHKFDLISKELRPESVFKFKNNLAWQNFVLEITSQYLSPEFEVLQVYRLPSRTLLIQYFDQKYLYSVILTAEKDPAIATEVEYAFTIQLDTDDREQISWQLNHANYRQGSQRLKWLHFVWLRIVDICSTNGNKLQVEDDGSVRVIYNKDHFHFQKLNAKYLSKLQKLGWVRYENNHLFITELGSGCLENFDKIVKNKPVHWKGNLKKLQFNTLLFEFNIDCNFIQIERYSKLLSAMKKCHRIRRFNIDSLNPKQVLLLDKRINYFNKKYNLALNLNVDKKDALNWIMRTFISKNAKNYIVLAGDENSGKILGFIAADLILYLKTIGLDSWLLVRNFNRRKFEVQTGKKVFAIIEFGFAKNKARKDKTLKMAKVAQTEKCPAWYITGVEACLHAANVVSLPDFSFNYSDEHAILKMNEHADLERGILKYYFEFASGMKLSE